MGGYAIEGCSAAQAEFLGIDEEGAEACLLETTSAGRTPMNLELANAP